MRGGGEEGVERRRERLPHTHGTRWPGKQPPPPPGSRALSPPLGTGGSDGRSGCRARRPRRARCCGVSGGDGERPGEPPKGCDGRRAMAPGCRALPEPRPRRAGAEPSPGRRRGEEGGGAPCSGPSSAGSGLQSPVSARAALLLIVLCPWEEKQNVLGAGRGRGPPSLPPSRPPPPTPAPLPEGAQGTPAFLPEPLRAERGPWGRGAAEGAPLRRVLPAASRAAECSPPPACGAAPGRGAVDRGDSGRRPRCCGRRTRGCGAAPLRAAPSRPTTPLQRQELGGCGPWHGSGYVLSPEAPVCLKSVCCPSLLGWGVCFRS